VKEQAVTAKPVAQPSDRAVRDIELSSDLPESGAGHEAVEGGDEEIVASQPVAGGEGLRTEVPAARMTAVPLDAVGFPVAEEEAFLLEPPRR
jgi:hypothetical protein